MLHPSFNITILDDYVVGLGFTTLEEATTIQVDLAFLPIKTSFELVKRESYMLMEFTLWEDNIVTFY